MKCFLTQFNCVDFVSEPGEFAVRGGIIDVFSYAHELPYRIEFFGDEVDSIRSFDIETQLSAETHKEIKVMPNVENKLLEESRESFLKFIPKDTLVLSQNSEIIYKALDKLFQKANTALTNYPKT